MKAPTPLRRDQLRPLIDEALLLKVHAAMAAIDKERALKVEALRDEYRRAKR